jgi:acetyl-CoA carboxylase, biotin carboxylase subunit
MIAKLVVWAPDRDGAIARMQRALGEFVIEGDRIRTTIDFLRTVLADERFAAAAHSTRLVDELLASPVVE